jgi:hypothetical protein
MPNGFIGSREHNWLTSKVALRHEAWWGALPTVR